jgi:hypothetical protein
MNPWPAFGCFCAHICAPVFVCAAIAYFGGKWCPLAGLLEGSPTGCLSDWNRRSGCIPAEPYPPLQQPMRLQDSPGLAIGSKHYSTFARTALSTFVRTTKDCIPPAARELNKKRLTTRPKKKRRGNQPRRLTITAAKQFTSL